MDLVKVKEAINLIPDFWKHWWEITFKGEMAELYIYLAMGFGVIILIFVLIGYLRKRRKW